MEYLYTDIGLTQNSVVADICSGTGKLTRQLLEHGCKVFAVEPNGDMRVAAERDLGRHDAFVSLCGSAEKTGLADASMDFITVGQAYHWFDRAAFQAECRRVLKPDGYVVLVWNMRDEQSEIVIQNAQVNSMFCPQFKGFTGGMAGLAQEGDFSDFFTGAYETKKFSNNSIFDETQFIGRNLSSSYALGADHEGYAAYVDALKALFLRYSIKGKLTVPGYTHSYAGHV